jgi:hypothetical protein
MPNWYIEFPAREARLLFGSMFAKYKPDGFLYYELAMIGKDSRKTAKVISTGPRTQWDPKSYGTLNGDGSLICPGVNGPLSTIRLENIRDGIEDYEYYQLLWKLLKERGEKADNWQVSDRVVNCLVRFTLNPEDVIAERSRIALKILDLTRKEAKCSASNQ